MAGNAFTTTSTVSNVVQTAYDQYLEFALRSTPMFRAIADKHPVDQSTAGASIVLQIWKDLADATTELTENVDPDSVAISQPDQVTLTVKEYGSATLQTKKLAAVALTDVDSAVANQVAYNCASSIDVLSQTALAAGLNSYVASGSNSQTLTFASSAPATARATVTNATNVSRISSTAVRQIVTDLRSNNVQPRKGEYYGCALHPRVALDLRTETGNNPWRDPHTYSAPDSIWAGELGLYEGAFFIENPRCSNATVGVSSARVFNSYFFGRQAMAEGVAVEPQIVIGEVTDKLKRFRPIGWYALIGWSVYRQAALYQLFTSAQTQQT